MGKWLNAADSCEQLSQHFLNYGLYQPRVVQESYLDDEENLPSFTVPHSSVKMWTFGSVRAFECTISTSKVYLYEQELLMNKHTVDSANQ